jgi:hypothetical protein
MKDHLLDLIQHTYELGYIDAIKVVGTDKETKITARESDQGVIITGTFATPIAEFIGTFGLPNLDTLKILLNMPEYSEKSVLKVTNKADTTDLEVLHFTNTAGDFTNTYRFMSGMNANQKVPDVSLRASIPWNVEFTPSALSIQRLKMQAQANSKVPLFSLQIIKGDLTFFFGDHSSHTGKFVFHQQVVGNLQKTWYYDVSQLLAILNLVGDKEIKISDMGALQVNVNSGLASYTYILPARTK